MIDALISPRFLKPGQTLGIFTPSSPAYRINPGLFENGVKNLERLGFKVKLGSLTQDRASEGYRSGSGKARAQELMELILDPEVSGVISTIGGYNSSGMIPFLDYDAIRRSRKIFCGYSDVTSLHLAILKYSGLRTFYGPAVMCWFGEWPEGIPESTAWFLDSVMNHQSGIRKIAKPPRWSNHRRNWVNGDWKNLERVWQDNSDGWRVLAPGQVEAPILAANLNTLLSAAGTSYWPDLEGKILLIEEEAAPLMREDRAFNQLNLMGVFDSIAGLIIGRPEVYESQEAPFGLEDLLLEVLGKNPKFPIVTKFDCGHTVPMLTVPQLSQSRLVADASGLVEFEFLEPACRND